MDLVSDPVTAPVTVPTKAKTVGVSGARGVAVALPAAVANSSERDRARKAGSVTESTKWRGPVTRSPVKVNGVAGATGLRVRCLVDLEHELVHASVYRCRAT